MRTGAFKSLTNNNRNGARAYFNGRVGMVKHIAHVQDLLRGDHGIDCFAACCSVWLAALSLGSI